MLVKRIIDVGKAFYVSNKLMPTDRSLDTSAFQNYKISCMMNGSWFILQESGEQSVDDPSPLNDLLIPHYMIVWWSSLATRKNLHVGSFDTVSVYYNKFLPTDPNLILTRGFTPEQIDRLAAIHGHYDLQARYPKDYLMTDC